MRLRLTAPRGQHRKSPCPSLIDDSGLESALANAGLSHQADNAAFIAFVGGASLGTWIFALDGFYLIAPIGLFIVAGIFMSACAVAGLLSGSARDYCHQRVAL